MFRVGLNMLCHMFRLGLKKAVLSHVSSVVEEARCVTCFVGVVVVVFFLKFPFLPIGVTLG